LPNKLADRFPKIDHLRCRSLRDATAGGEPAIDALGYRPRSAHPIAGLGEIGPSPPQQLPCGGRRAMSSISFESFG
jgi:hypothetical protein